jgi:hypothetical protein
MMQSALLRRAKNSVRSIAVVTPAEFPFFEVEPSAPATRVTMTGMSVRIFLFSYFYEINPCIRIEISLIWALALKHEISALSLNLRICSGRYSDSS